MSLFHNVIVQTREKEYNRFTKLINEKHNMNMSYCRFENTLRDLQDCKDAMDEMRAIDPDELSRMKQQVEDFDNKEFLSSAELDKMHELCDIIKEADEYELSDSEQSAKDRMIILCKVIVDEMEY